MTSNIKGAGSGKAVSGAYPSGSVNNPSILLEKLNARRSTPDSEALASSDDEGDSQRQEQSSLAAPTQKPVRRASWLNDTTQPLGQPRKGSFASSSMSPTTSHPSTPSADSGNWNPHVSTATTTGMGRGHQGTSSFPWGTGIWNSDARKDPPSRLTEVLPSPTSINASNGGSIFSSDIVIKNPQLSRDQHPETTIPFAIPLHPTPKTYRSQSYSVGQLDPDAKFQSHSAANASAFNGRGRGLPHSGLQHRPSRPSMLSEMSSEGIGLGKLKEVEDDDDDASTNESNSGTHLQDQTKALEILARENALLRQQNYHSSRLRPRSSTSTSLNNYSSNPNPYTVQSSLPQESDYAIDELDENAESQGKNILGRRLSEYAAGQASRGPALGSAYNTLENRKLENVKRAYWQSSLGFGGLSDIPQSRRHSFADVPTRHGSISSIGEALPIHENHASENDDGSEEQGRHAEMANFPSSEHAASYFGSNAARNQDIYVPSPYPQSVYQSYAMNTPYTPGRSTSPHRAMYGVAQPRHNQPLYIVLFKCSRADVFYVQEGTGLSVKPGDLVIVEADRGTDLGTVAQDNVDWAQAKELKEHYAEEHYKWLMMYSQGAAASSDGTGAGLMAASNGLQGSAVGGMGPPSQHGMQEPNSGELKPKIIKRLAQNHEIQALRDKEGNEAKAKRVCMQKVKEHGLHMEILDAEFQMDWKKLTFYYFADAYINFNSLVTDLFKVYKTRIWMSAINPASFASPSLGLQAPSGVGPGAVGVNRPAQAERRTQAQDQPSFNSIVQNNRAFQVGQSGPFAGTPDRSHILPNPFSQPNFGYGYSPFGAAPRTAPPSVPGYTPNMLPQMEQYSNYPTSADYQQIPARFPSPHTLGIGTDGGEFSRHSNGHSSGNEGWMTSFQGLSLNSR